MGQGEQGRGGDAGHAGHHPANHRHAGHDHADDQHMAAAASGCCGGKHDGRVEGPAVAIDPVCGMRVTIATAKHRFQYQGQEYLFCCARCRERHDMMIAASPCQQRDGSVRLIAKCKRRHLRTHSKTRGIAKTSRAT